MSTALAGHRRLLLLLQSLVPSFVPSAAPLHVRCTKLAPEAGLRLNQGASARLGVAEGRTLCRLAGSVWITHDGAPKDIVIEAGDSYHVASRERTAQGR